VDVSHIVRGGDRLGLYFVEHGASQRASRVLYDRAHSAFSEAEPAEFDWANTPARCRVVALERHHARSFRTLREGSLRTRWLPQICRSYDFIRYELPGEAVVTSGRSEDARPAPCACGCLHLWFR
jgi:hypothetical protein